MDPKSKNFFLRPKIFFLIPRKSSLRINKLLKLSLEPLESLYKNQKLLLKTEKKTFATIFYLLSFLLLVAYIIYPKLNTFFTSWHICYSNQEENIFMHIDLLKYMCLHIAWRSMFAKVFHIKTFVDDTHKRKVKKLTIFILIYKLFLSASH